MWSIIFSQMTMGLSPETNRTTRLVYNRVDKAGSSSLSRILGVQCRVLKCHMDAVPGGKDFPRKDVYTRTLTGLPAHSVFIRHAHHLRSVGPEFAWINLVREPVERWASMYDWQRSTQFRRNTGHGPNHEVDPCQQVGWSFEACMEQVRAENASLVVPSQMKYFCEPDENCLDEFNCKWSATCTLQQALHTLHNRYHLVGLTEDFATSIAAFEWLLPLFFRNASRMAGLHENTAASHGAKELKTHARSVPHNSTAFKTVSEQAVNFAEEMALYDYAKQLFYHKWAQIERAGDESVTHSGRAPHPRSSSSSGEEGQQ